MLPLNIFLIRVAWSIILFCFGVKEDDEKRDEKILELSHRRPLAQHCASVSGIFLYCLTQFWVGFHTKSRRWSFKSCNSRSFNIRTGETLSITARRYRKIIVYCSLELKLRTHTKLRGEAHVQGWEGFPQQRILNEYLIFICNGSFHAGKKHKTLLRAFAAIFGLDLSSH